MTDGGSAGGATMPPGKAMLGVAPTTGAFGQVVKGQMSASLTFSVRNEGDAPSGPLTATLSGTDAAQFTLATNGCTTALAPNGSCDISVRFVPTQTGARSANLAIAGANALSVSLTGEGIPPSALSATPSLGDFKGVALGGGADASFTVSNTGAETSGALAVSLEGTDAALFSLASDGCSTKTLTGAASCTIKVHFAPTNRGAKSATLKVAATPGGVLTASLAGTGLAPASFSVSPAMQSFANAVKSGSTGTEKLKVTITNAGDMPGAPSYTLSNSTDFTTTNGCSGVTLSPAETCDITFTLAPKSAGALTTTLTLAAGTGVSGKSTATINGLASDQLTLMVSVAGSGTGSVSAVAGVEGNGIACPGDCAESYTRTTTAPVVGLTATFNATTTSVSWSAPCAGSTTSCSVTLSAAQIVTVTFTKKTFAITVTKSAEATGATGTVTGTGVSCGSSCSTTLAAGDMLTLTATPASGYYFSAWSGASGCTNGALTCTVGPLTADAKVDAKFTKANLIFPTSTTYTVDQFAALGGGNPQTGADKLCRDRAAAGTAAGLGGRTWISLITLGDGGGAAAATPRLGTKRGWVRVDGRPFGDTPASLFDGTNKIFYPPAVDENGTVVDQGQSLLGAAGDGCVKWTSALRADYRSGGVPSAGGSGWYGAYGMPCDYEARLYCVSIDYTATVTAPGITGSPKIAFITDGQFKPGTGLAGADALCAKEASAASLSGTFKALLATSTATAVSRFPSANSWVRPDGVSVGTAAQMAQGKQLDGSLQVSPTLRYFGLVGPWTGADNAGMVSTTALTCSDWTSTSGVGITGRSWNTDAEFFQQNYNMDCSMSAPIYCLQQ